jgi:hypothetical protein
VALLLVVHHQKRPVGGHWITAAAACVAMSLAARGQGCDL